MTARLSDKQRFPVTGFCIKKAILGRVPILIITRSKYLAAKRAHKRMINELRLESVFDFLIASYEELEHECLRLALKKGISHQIEWQEAIDDISIIERRIFNFLAAARAYLDKSKSIARQIGGTDMFDQFSSKISAEYDRYFSYRLLEALRNHSQHAGSIIASATFFLESLDDKSPEEQGDPRIVSTIRLMLDVRELAQNSNFKKAIIQEAQGQTDKKHQIILMPHVRRYVSSIGVAHEWLRKQTDTTSNCACKILSDLVQEYIVFGGDDILGLECMAVSKEKVAADRFPLFDEPAKRITRLREKNNHSSLLCQLIISSDSPKLKTTGK